MSPDPKVEQPTKAPRIDGPAVRAELIAAGLVRPAPASALELLAQGGTPDPWWVADLPCFALNP